MEHEPSSATGSRRAPLTPRPQVAGLVMLGGATTLAIAQNGEA